MPSSSLPENKMLIVVDIIGKTFHHSLAAIRSKPNTIFSWGFLISLHLLSIFASGQPTAWENMVICFRLSHKSMELVKIANFCSSKRMTEGTLRWKLHLILMNEEQSLWNSFINTRNNRSKYLYFRHCDVRINGFAEILCFHNLWYTLIWLYCSIDWHLIQC